jgi:hypothetical protein
MVEVAEVERRGQRGERGDLLGVEEAHQGEQVDLIAVV